MVNADSIPRYEEPTFEELCEDDFDEVICCEHCGHCMPITDAEFNRVWSHMTPYGHWHKYEREVKLAMRYALKHLGTCEVRGELVELADVPCDHLWEGE